MLACLMRRLVHCRHRLTIAGFELRCATRVHKVDAAIAPIFSGSRIALWCIFALAATH